MEKYIVKLVINDNTHPYDLKNEFYGTKVDFTKDVYCRKNGGLTNEIEMATTYKKLNDAIKFARTDCRWYHRTENVMFQVEKVKVNIETIEIIDRY